MLVADVIKVLTLITHSLTGTGTRAYNRDVQAVHCSRGGKQERGEKDIIFSPVCSLKSKATAPLDKMCSCMNLSGRDKENMPPAASEKKIESTKQ